MSTDPQQERTLGQLVASASADISALFRGEIALAKAELGQQVKKAGIGGALLAAAGVIAFYSVYFVFITIAEGIQALGLSRWLSFLIVTVFMLLIAGVLALVGIRRMKTVEPTPAKTIENAKATVAGIKAATNNPGTVTPAPRPVIRGQVAGSTSAARSSSTSASANSGSTTRPDPSRDA